MDIVLQYTGEEMDEKNEEIERLTEHGIAQQNMVAKRDAEIERLKDHNRSLCNMMKSAQDDNAHLTARLDAAIRMGQMMRMDGGDLTRVNIIIAKLRGES